jgi:hypothetical protein
MIVFANSSVTIFSYIPPRVAGTVGAVFNSPLQLGSAVGLAADSSLGNPIDQNTTSKLPVSRWSLEAFKGRAAFYWFLLAILFAVSLTVIVFFKVDVLVHAEPKSTEKVYVEAVPSERQ